jgi:hypothetical protein
VNLGRIILLASLAQLLGLPALAAALSEQPAVTTDAAKPSPEATWKLLTVAQGEINLGSVSHDRTSLAVLAVTALAETPLRHSVWMVAPAVRTVPVPRPCLYTLLRC